MAAPCMDTARRWARLLLVSPAITAAIHGLPLFTGAGDVKATMHSDVGATLPWPHAATFMTKGQQTLQISYEMKQRDLEGMHLPLRKCRR